MHRRQDIADASTSWKTSPVTGNRTSDQKVMKNLMTVGRFNLYERMLIHMASPGLSQLPQQSLYLAWTVRKVLVTVFHPVWRKIASILCGSEYNWFEEWRVVGSLKLFWWQTCVTCCKKRNYRDLLCSVMKINKKRKLKINSLCARA